MARALFVYWKVALAQVGLAQRAAQAMQRQLSAAHPLLQAQLLLRADGAGAGMPGDAPGEAPVDAPGDALGGAPVNRTVTLMETYAHPAGVGSALQTAIDKAAGRALGGFISGARHVEIFDRLPP